MKTEVINLCPEKSNATLTTYIANDEPELMMPPRIALLICPGGGYHWLSDREAEPIAKTFFGAGMNCFVLRYSLNEKACFPQPLVEASLAMKHIRENAEKYNIDPERVFVIGFSAGGHLAASLGTLWHKDYVYENAMYVKDALLLKYNGEAVPFDISIGQCEDFYYMSVGVDTSEYEIVADEDTIDADMWNGRGSLDATSVDDTAYYIEGNCGYQLYIYYPKDKFPKLPDAYDDIPIRIATCNDNKDGERSYGYAFSADSLGKNEPEEYEVFWLYHADAEDASFRFQYDRGD